MKNLLNKDGLTEEEFLKAYKPGDYDRPSVTVDMLIFTVADKENKDIKKLDNKELKIMLIKRKDHPYIGQWAIPGGFVNIDESLDEAAARELKEETNIDNVYMNQIYTWGDPKRDPRMRVISSSYMALVPQKGLKPKAGDDAEDLDWFTVKRETISKSSTENKWLLTLTSSDEKIKIAYEVTDKYVRRGVSVDVVTTVSENSLTEDSLAFDHVNIVALALTRLKNQIKYTSIAFNLAGEYFTLSELMSIYEIILGEKINPTQFRRDIKHMILPTEYMYHEKGYRPAKYYKFNPNYMEL